LRFVKFGFLRRKHGKFRLSVGFFWASPDASLMSKNAKRQIAILVIKTAQQVSPNCCGNAKAWLKVVYFCSNGVVVLQAPRYPSTETACVYANQGKESISLPAIMPRRSNQA
jgi:hypothetical protein